MLREDMLWQLAHFGLELSSREEVLKHSSLEVKYGDSSTTADEPIAPMEGSLCDPRLDGPPIEQTLLNTMGHILLEVPVARPECIDQIVEIVNQSSVVFDYPLRKFGKNTGRTYFWYETGDENDHYPVNPLEIYQHLLSYHQYRKTVIHGDQFTEHNVEASPLDMMISILPVPSLLARSSPNTAPLTKKLNHIIRLNDKLRSLMFMKGPSKEMIGDIVAILTYHVMTYLDNAIPGVPSDEDLPAGIAQLIGTKASLLPENDLSSDIAGTTLHRIVRGINMGETVLNVHAEGEESENLAFELCKQIAFNRIWKHTGKETQLIYINNFGEVQRMLIGVIEDLNWSHWNGNPDIERDIVMAPRFSNELIEERTSKKLSETIGKLREIDRGFSLELGEHRVLNFLYNLLDKSTNDLEQQIIICDSFMNPVVLRPFLRLLKERNIAGSNVSLLLTQMVVDSAVKYHYTPTPDDFRNLIIALTNLNERREFEYKKMMFKHIRPTDLKLISTYVKDLTRKEMTQLLGEVILAKGGLDIDFLRNYITDYLKREERSIQHLKPKPRKPKRTLTLEEIYDSSTEVFEKVYSENLHKSLKKEKEQQQQQQQGNDSLYESLKGLEPLVQWAKLKGRLFTPEAAEFGFVNYPRGLLLTGVPGCGKTMAAKIIAQEWGMNLHRVNPDDITSRFHGGNEENMRKLLDKLVSDAPSICFVDEAEKLFTQMTSEIQSAATQGIDSTESMLLQFMEENEAPVFFIFTCNELGKMSPAIIDRFDARFFVDLPDVIAREEIIRLMLKERKKGTLNLDYNSLANKSQSFTGRDIRGAVEEAMMVAFAENRELEQGDLEASFSSAKPTSAIHAQKIEAIRKLVLEGRIRAANSTPIISKDGKEQDYDVSFG